MSDIRIDRWAYTLVHYCLYLKPGDVLAIQTTPQASPLIEAVYREALQVGAHPAPVIELENLEELLLRVARDSNIAKSRSSRRHANRSIPISTTANIWQSAGVSGPGCGEMEHVAGWAPLPRSAVRADRTRHSRDHRQAQSSSKTFLSSGLTRSASYVCQVASRSGRIWTGSPADATACHSAIAGSCQYRDNDHLYAGLRR